MKDEPNEESPERPMRVVVIGAGDTELGRELTRRIFDDPKLRGRIEILSEFPAAPVKGHEILDLNGAVERIRAEREELMGPVAQPTLVRRADLYPMHPLDGKSKYDRRRKWWNR